MRIFLITLLVSAVASIVLWNFGLAHKIWPSHPIVATAVIAVVCGIGVQLALTYESARDKP